MATTPARTVRIRNACAGLQFLLTVRSALGFALSPHPHEVKLFPHLLSKIQFSPVNTSHVPNLFCFLMSVGDTLKKLKLKLGPYTHIPLTATSALLFKADATRTERKWAQRLNGTAGVQTYTDFGPGGSQYH